jgi:hypothetical protein
MNSCYNRIRKVPPKTYASLAITADLLLILNECSGVASIKSDAFIIGYRTIELRLTRR